MIYPNCVSKIDELKKTLDHNRPLSPDVLKKLREYYRVSLTYTSNALEGNSLTETETKIVLEDGITIGGKPMKDHLEAVGHSDAYSLLYDLVKQKKITESDILALHHLFYFRIDPHRAGQYRKENVVIPGAPFTPPPFSQIPELIKKWIAGLTRLRKKHHPIEFAALLHKEFVTIHPFIDGNGRTASLLMNLALLQTGYVITIIPPVVRDEYINALKASQKKPADNQPFINFISTMVYESIQDYMRIIKALI